MDNAETQGARPHVTRTSARDDYATPWELFNALDAVYDFTLDAAASRENAKCSQFYDGSPGYDALEETWEGETIFCNPPFGIKEAFLARGVAYRNLNPATLFLVPNNAREAKWWRDYAIEADLIINLYPRVNYLLDGKPTSGVAFPTCALVYHPRIEGVEYGTPKEVYFNWKGEGGSDG